jgi:two-component system, chemotaxis family, chemotaxis protein CheY
MAKVLVVDDAAFMRVRAARVLQESGHEVVQAEDGADAVRQYAAHKPFQPDRVLDALQKLLAA